MEPRQNFSKSMSKSSAAVPDLDIDDLLEGSAPLAHGAENSRVGKSVLLPPSRCFKGRLVARQDFFSSNGKSLVRSGQILDVDTAELLARKRMKENPLDLPLSIPKVGVEQLLSDFELLIRNKTGFSEFVALNGGVLAWQCTLKELLFSADDSFIYLAQLRNHNPQAYNQSLCCSWLCGILAESIGLNQEKVAYSVLAGLFHQIGKLQLSPSLQSLTDNQCTREEWGEFQEYVIYGKLLLRNAGSIDLLVVADIVAQQGEYANGLGYPFSLREAELRQESMLLCLCRDLYQFLFFDGGSLGDCVLFLQLHEARFGRAGSWEMQKKINTFLRTQEMESYSDCSYSEKMADYLIETSIVLAQVHAATSLIIRPVKCGLNNGDKQYLGTHLVNLLQQIDDYKNNSGIADIELVAGVDSMQYEDAQLLDGEIYQIIQRQRGLLALFSEVDFLLERVLESISGPAMPEVLSEVVDLHSLIHDALEPFKDGSR